MRTEESKPDKIVYIPFFLFSFYFLPFPFFFLPLWTQPEVSQCLFWSLVCPITPCLYIAFSPDDVEGIELLRWEDQQKIRKYLEGGGSQATSAPTVMECSIEVSQTSRATCRRCNQKIMKGEVNHYAHVPCFQIIIYLMVTCF